MHVECYIRKTSMYRWERKYVIVGYNKWRIEVKLLGVIFIYVYREGDIYGITGTHNGKVRCITYGLDNSGWELRDCVHRRYVNIIKDIMNKYSDYISRALRLRPPYKWAKWPGDVMVVTHN
jgi:hypothetical protein